MAEQNRPVVALVADIVGSRQLADRASAQQRIHEAFARAEQAVRPLQGAWATVGDEFQAVYRTWQDALRATLRVAVFLPENVVLRYGLGEEELRVVERRAEGDILEGTAWYRAREAVDEAAGSHRPSGLATAYVGPAPELTASLNAQLLLRDHVVGRLKARERRLLGHLLDGLTQTEAAQQEGVSQSAVSQAVHRSGGAHLLEADRLLGEDPREERGR